MTNFKAYLAIALFWLYVPYATASATSNEFVPCNKMAVYQLRDCLQKTNANSNKHCWVKSRQAFDNCAQKVKSTHNSTHRRDKHSAAKQLQAQYQLDKKLRPNTIKSRLMGAANLSVYQRELEQVLENLDKKLGLTHLTQKQLKAVSERELAYQRFLALVEQNVHCDEMKDKIVQAYQSNAANTSTNTSSRTSTNTLTKTSSKVTALALPKAAREIDKHIASYCRILLK